MKFTVIGIMTKFYDATVERRIDIPEDEAVGASVNDILDLAFKYGQNEFQPRKVCSISVGDVICVKEQGVPRFSWMTANGLMRMHTRFFEVKGVGFEEITMQQLGNLGRKAQTNPDNVSEVARYHSRVKAKAEIKAEAKALQTNFDEEPIAPCRQAIHDELYGYDDSNY